MINPNRLEEVEAASNPYRTIRRLRELKDLYSERAMFLRFMEIYDANPEWAAAEWMMDMAAHGRMVPLSEADMAAEAGYLKDVGPRSWAKTTPPSEEAEEVIEAQEEADFWQRRELFRKVYAIAGAKQTSPWGLLGHGILRALHTIPASVRFSSFVASSPINLGVVFLGTPGSDKSIMADISDEFYRFADAPEWPSALEARSGEGIPDAYAMYDKDDEIKWRTHELQWSCDEVGRLEATGNGRKGSTIFEVLKSAITGDPLGGALAGGKGPTLPKGSYRFTLYINAQPERCAFMFSDDEIAGGFPQRFLWMDVAAQAPKRDRNLRLHHTVPALDWPEGYQIRATEPMSDFFEYQRANRNQIGLDGHAGMTRAKIAIALMVLDGRTRLSDADWLDAGAVLEHSNETRWHAQTAAVEAEARSDIQQGVKSARRYQAQQGELNRAALLRNRVAGWIKAEPFIKRRSLSAKLGRDYRNLDDALQGILMDSRQDPMIIEHAQRLLDSSTN